MKTVEENTKAITDYLAFNNIVLNEEQIAFIKTCVECAFLDGRVLNLSNLLEQSN